MTACCFSLFSPQITCASSRRRTKGSREQSRASHNDVPEATEKQEEDKEGEREDSRMCDQDNLVKMAAAAPQPQTKRSGRVQ